MPEAIEEELARLEAAGELGRVKAIYVTTYYDNPSAVTVPAERRAAHWSRSPGAGRKRHRIYVIEDAAYRELRYDGDDAPSLRAFDPEGDTVIHAGTFSKSFSPGIRVGWGVLPPALLRPVLAEKGNIDFGSPHFNQVLMATVLQERALRPARRAASGDLSREDRRHRCGGRRVLAAHRRHRVGAAQRRAVPLAAAARGIDTGFAGPLFDRAVAEGVLYVPGEHCYPAEGQPRPRNMLRLSFGSVSLRRSSAAACEALGRAIRQVRLNDAHHRPLPAAAVRADVPHLLLEPDGAVHRHRGLDQPGGVHSLRREGRRRAALHRSTITSIAGSASSTSPAACWPWSRPCSRSPGFSGTTR